MKKNIIASNTGKRGNVGHLKINRLIPFGTSQSVGPFVFLDHLLPYEQKPQTSDLKDGKFAHPHRGIATFSILLSGELEHYDSKGNYGIVKAGGAQWMKAGNGLLHDEGVSPEFQENGGLLHGMQFWINLPSENKEDEPEYLALQPELVPEIELPNVGKVKVFIGEWGGKASPVKTHSLQFIYQICLNPGASYQLKTIAGLEYAAFIPEREIEVNNIAVDASSVLLFSESGDEISLTNNANQIRNVIVFGGEPYDEPIVAEGPFVMNTRAEIADAYSDFFNGNYGIISYKKVI